MTVRLRFDYVEPGIGLHDAAVSALKNNSGNSPFHVVVRHKGRGCVEIDLENVRSKSDLPSEAESALIDTVPSTHQRTTEVDV